MIVPRPSPYARKFFFSGVRGRPGDKASYSTKTLCKAATYSNEKQLVLCGDDALGQCMIVPI